MHPSASRSKKPVSVFFTPRKILLMYLKKKLRGGSPSRSEKKNALKDHIKRNFKHVFLLANRPPQKKTGKKIKYADDMLFFQFELLTLFVPTEH